MSDYISREAAIEYLTLNMGWNDEDGYPVDDWDERRAHIADLVNGIPAADVRPVVKATWIVKEMQALFPGMDEHPVFACSECGYQIYDLLDNVKEQLHYCPNCGADMRPEPPKEDEHDT